jgi:hypothetical protein
MVLIGIDTAITIVVAATVAGSSRSGSQSGETFPTDFIIATTIPSYGWRGGIMSMLTRSSMIAPTHLTSYVILMRH